MTAVTEVFRKIAVIGDLKLIVIQCGADTESDFTIDLKSSVGPGQAAKEVLNTLVQDDEGADVAATWDPATGIITMGTISTGIHNITVFAR